ncbi:MAG TPA: isocitrate lyase/phosphoenolpyruvate mutase family protein [Lapillicoccus sp.]|nr:isocitrate lyase/phosphoenolpyruvate mutase family protein [Lapillicoccus sp.]
MNDRATDFLALHVPGTPLLMPNPWDAGSARMLAAMGFRALATTSAGLAGTHGRTDGNMTRDEALTHAATLVSAVDVPVSADLENGWGDDPAEVAETIRLAVESGVAGCSVEDWDPSRHELYAAGDAAERVAAAAEAAHGGNRRIVLTARADGHVHGRRDPEDLDDTIRRLQAYEQAGADVLYAPGVNSVESIRRIVGAVTRPVNVLAMPDAPPVRRLAELGVARVSTGSGFYWAAMGGLAAAAEELRDSGTYAFWADARAGRAAAAAEFTDGERAPRP